MKRFLNVEKNTFEQQKLHGKYSKFVRELIDIDHMENVPEKD